MLVKMLRKSWSEMLHMDKIVISGLSRVVPTLPDSAKNLLLLGDPTLSLKGQFCAVAKSTFFSILFGSETNSSPPVSHSGFVELCYCNCEAGLLQCNYGGAALEGTWEF